MTSTFLIAEHRSCPILGREHPAKPCYGGCVPDEERREDERELLHRRPWRTKDETTMAITDYIERFYNPKRLHSTLGYMSPNEFEAASIQPALAA